MRLSDRLTEVTIVTLRKRERERYLFVDYRRREANFADTEAASGIFLCAWCVCVYLEAGGSQADMCVGSVH